MCVYTKCEVQILSPAARMKQRQNRAERLGGDIGENGRRAGNFCRFFSRNCGVAAKKAKANEMQRENFSYFSPETLRFFAAAERIARKECGTKRIKQTLP